jgi:hypothetical protein
LILQNNRLYTAAVQLFDSISKAPTTRKFEPRNQPDLDPFITETEGLLQKQRERSKETDKVLNSEPNELLKARILVCRFTEFVSNY